MAYAEKTDVSVGRTKGEIDNLLRKYKATGFGSFEEGKQAMIVFDMRERRIRFVLPLPDRLSKDFTHSSKGLRAEHVADAAWEQACRAKWRALLLCIKAKLESVEAGIETFEDSFLAHIQMPNGDRVGDMVRPAIAESYRTKTMQPLLPAPT